MPPIVPRDKWDAAAPDERHTLVLPSARLWLHHSAVEWHGARGVKQTQEFHMGPKGWNDIAYSFLVDDDGTIYEGRGVGVVGAHTEGDNSKSHGICAMGNFDVRAPGRPLIEAIAALVRDGHTAGWWPDRITGGHRDHKPTACPGRHLYAQIAAINALALEAQPSTFQPHENLHRCQERSPRVDLLTAQWQIRLHAVGGPDLGRAGEFGFHTESATREFQRAVGLDADGIVGPKTQAAMQWIITAQGLNV